VANVHQHFNYFSKLSANVSQNAKYTFTLALLTEVKKGKFLEALGTYVEISQQSQKLYGNSENSEGNWRIP